MIGGSPLAVRLFDGLRDQHVTKACESYSWTKTAPGGHSRASVRLNVTRDDWPDLGDSDRLVFSDRVGGATAWEGYANQPGNDYSETGEGFDLTAKGGADRLADDRRALLYIDQAGDPWNRNPNLSATARADWSTNPNTGAQGVMVGFPPGFPVAAGHTAEMAYQFNASDMEFGAIEFSVRGGSVDTAYSVRMNWSGVSNGGINMATLTTSPLSGGGYVGDGTLPASGTTGLGLSITRTTGSGNVPNDTSWAHYAGIKILGRRRDKFGTLVSGAAGMVRTTHVLASEVVADLIGRMLPWVDAAGSTIETTNAQIDQLTYWQAVSAAQVLDDLGLWDADMLHEVLHTTGTGKHILNYRSWPTSHRYEISTRDGYTQPGSDQGLCNRVIVSWTDADGHPQTYLGTAYVPALEDAGRVRHADAITLPDGQGSLANATAIAAEVLYDINQQATSATAVVKRPIYDITLGRLVQPWEIEPGYLVRVRETGDLLRLTQMTYDWSRDGTSRANLTLGRPVLSLNQRLKRLERRAA